MAETQETRGTTAWDSRHREPRQCGYSECTKQVAPGKATGRRPKYCPPEQTRWPDGQSCQDKAKAQRAAARTSGVEGGLAAIRQAAADLDDQLAALDSPLSELADQVADTRQDLQTLQTQLLTRAETAEAAAAAATDAAQTAQDTAEAATLAQRKAQQAADVAHQDLREAQAARERAEQLLRDAQSAMARLQAERDAERTRADAADLREQNARVLIATQTQAAADAAKQAAEHAVALATATAELQALRTTLDTANARTASETTRAAAAEQHAESLRADLADLRDQHHRDLASARADTDRVRDHLDGQLQAARDRHEQAQAAWQATVNILNQDLRAADQARHHAQTRTDTTVTHAARLAQALSDHYDKQHDTMPDQIREPLAALQALAGPPSEANPT